jgi:lipoprotein-anchoring transpeptidase ErfK/SrfK
LSGRLLIAYKAIIGQSGTARGFVRPGALHLDISGNHMIYRSLVLLGLSVVLALGNPAAARSASATTPQTASLETQKPKPKIKAKNNTKRSEKSKAIAKAKKKIVKQEEAKAKPIGGLLSTFFRNSRQPREQKAANVVVPKREVLPSFEHAALENNGELRSELQPRPSFLGLFRAEQQMLPQTRALDSALAQRDAKKKFTVRSEFAPQEVAFTGYRPGTVVIDTGARYLYLVESGATARRYAIAVGREGLEFKGRAKVGDKQEWPRWIPTKEMQQREPKKYGQYKNGMSGGPDNPLGARAIYLYQGKKDTHVRIHGTNQPQTIGTNSSNGCFRMINDHVIDLYRRVKVGTEVVVL